MTPVSAKSPAQLSAVPVAGSRHAWARYAEVCAPYLLALLFFGLALYRVNQTEVVDTDAARHAMNGAFIYDLLRTGHLLHPVAYAKAYYRQLPSLSMPFHPPLFPGIESIFFAVFGVNLLTARLAVAVAVAISVILLYKLVLSTLGRPIVVASVTLATFSLWTLQYVARDVMLEFPAMVFTLAALYCLRDYSNSYPMRRAIPFAVFAAAAVWSKQHTVFLGAVPFVYAFLIRRWRRFLEPPLWISSALFGAAVLGVVQFSKLFHGVGVDQISTSGRDVYYIVTSTLPAYFTWFTADLLGLPGVFVACALVAYLWARRRGAEKLHLGLYFSWILACLAVLIDLGPISKRYLFFIFPAMTAIGFAWLFHGCRWFWGERRAGIVAAVFAIAFFADGLRIPFDFLRGPGAAAQVVVNGMPAKETPLRVLYAGDADGNFIFALRALDPNLRFTVIPAMKLPRKLLQSADVGQLCKRFGIEWVVFENVPKLPWSGLPPWSNFKGMLPAVAQLQRSIPLQSSRFRWHEGSIDVYRFDGTGQHPDSALQPPLPPKLQEDSPAKL